MSFLNRTNFNSISDPDFSIITSTFVSRIIPNQLPISNELANLETITAGAKNAIYGVTATNFVVSNLLSSSLGPLYGLINTLQIITHLQAAHT